MILSLFRRNRSSVLVLVAILAALLWSKSIIGLDNKIFLFAFDEHDMPIYAYLIQFVSNPLVLKIIAILLLLIQAFLLIRIYMKHFLIENQTYLPVLIFILTTSSIIPLQRMHPVLLSNILLIFIIDLLYISFKAENSLSIYFQAAFYVSVGSLIYLNFIFFAPIIFISIIILKPYNWRDWIVSIAGLIAPFLILWATYFLFDIDFNLFIQQVLNSFDTEKAGKLPIIFVVFLAYIFFLSLLAIHHILLYKKFKISTRKFYLIFFWFAILNVIIFFSLKSSGIELLLPISIPLSIIISNYLISMKKKWLAEVFLILFFILVFLIQILSR